VLVRRVKSGRRLDEVGSPNAVLGAMRNTNFHRVSKDQSENRLLPDVRRFVSDFRLVTDVAWNPLIDNSRESVDRGVGEQPATTALRQGAIGERLVLLGVVVVQNFEGTYVQPFLG